MEVAQVQVHLMSFPAGQAAYKAADCPYQSEQTHRTYLANLQELS